MLLRLFRTGTARLQAHPAAGSDAAVHEGWVCDGPAPELPGTLLHYSYPDVSTYRIKYDRYTSIEAQELPPSVGRVFLAGAASIPRLLWLLLRKGALLDGPRGWYVAYRVGALPRRRGTQSLVAMTRSRVGLDARMTRQMSVGMKTYAAEITARLPRVAPEYEYVAFSDGGNFGWNEQVRMPLAMRRARLDLIHFLALYVPLAVPAKFVVTIHDLIHLRFPQYFKAKVTPYYQTVVRWACARASRVITDDARTVDDLVELLGVDRGKVRVIPLGVAEDVPQARCSRTPARGRTCFTSEITASIRTWRRSSPRGRRYPKSGTWICT